MMKRKAGRIPVDGLADDPQWYKDAVIYELRVGSFNDSSGDGVGDIKGLTEKLDYLQDLGVTALWLLPICPSPGRDDGYDISEYCDVSPEMGTLDDFREFLDQAHRRGLRVITELVLNHTSDQHPWFQRARRAPPGSSFRNFYVWSDTPNRYEDARIIFKDFEHSNWAWDSVAKSHYWHRFYSHQPDLNCENPDVRQALMDVVDFWFNLGVDGLRLDAVPYLFEAEGTNCENLPATHNFLREVRKHIDSKFKNRMLLAEANQWPEDAAAYFGNGDECHMNFHFPIMPRLFMSIHMEDRFPIADILAQTPALPEPCQWALFLRNHDELTLEMVTDEERDYMYRAYANDPTMRINLGIRRRLAPLVGNDRSKIELMNGLLCSLPGTPVLYYGDEIGMGDNVYLGDRNGVRTPMQWSADRNAGFSRANPQRLVLPVIIDPEYHYESSNVEAQQNNTNSLLWWTKRLLALRRRFQAFGRGSIEFLHPENHRVLAFIRRFGDEIVLVVANLSRFIQYVELDLSKLKGYVPVELFGRTDFPPIGDLPYLLTLSEHSFYWFGLRTPQVQVDDLREASYQPPTLDLKGALETLWAGADRAQLEAALPAFIQGRRWYSSRDRDLVDTKIIESVPLAEGPRPCMVTVVRAEFSEGPSELYLLPLAIESGERAQEMRSRSSQAIVAHLRAPMKEGAATALVVDALAEGGHCLALIDAMTQQQRVRGVAGQFSASSQAPIPSSGQEGRALESKPLRGEHRHAALVIGDKYLVKAQRRLDEGPTAELEVGRFLSGRNLSAPVAPLLGAFEYRARQSEPTTLLTLHGYVANEGTAWQHVSEHLGRFYQRVLTGNAERTPVARTMDALLDQALSEPVPVVEELVGSSLDAARLLGERLAELHLALSSEREHPHFAPEPYTSLAQRSSYQSMRNLAGRVLRSVRAALPRLDPRTAADAQQLLAQVPALYGRFEPLLQRKLAAMRIRVHGDFHLRKVLYTGKDFVIIDFDSDRSLSLADRRRRRSAVRDLASMIHAFDSAAFSVLMDPAVVREPDRPVAERWALLWQRTMAASFVRSYLKTAGAAPFVPPMREELVLRLETFVIARMLDEITESLSEKTPRTSHLLRGLTRILTHAPG